MSYRVRKGTSRRKSPVTGYDALLKLPYRETEDDGKEVRLDVCEPWPTVDCPDCGKAPLVWAEACFVPGHRICPCCGSHWSLDPKDGSWLVRRARFY